MLVSIRPSLEQIRYHVDLSLNAVREFDPETAIAICKVELGLLDDYLDKLGRAKDAVIVDASVHGRLIRLENAPRGFEAGKSVNVEISPPGTAHLRA